MLDAVAGVDNAGAEANNTVVDFNRSQTLLKKTRKRRRTQTSASGQSVNIWDASDSDESEEEVDWQEVMDARKFENNNLQGGGAMSMWLEMEANH